MKLEKNDFQSPLFFEQQKQLQEDWAMLAEP